MFLTLQYQDLHDGEASIGYEVYFSPKPDSSNFPTVWLDLHVGGDHYQETGEAERARAFDRGHDGRPTIRIRPHRSVRVTTLERIGLSTRRTAIVMNVASRAKHGLIVAPGKIDPGFNPARLVLVIYNQSSRVIRIQPGDKVACLAVGELSIPARATSSIGHALTSAGSDFEPRVGTRLARFLRDLDYAAVPGAVARYMIAPIIVIVAAYCAGMRR